MNEKEVSEVVASVCHGRKQRNEWKAMKWCPELEGKKECRGWFHVVVTAGDLHPRPSDLHPY